MGKHVLDLCCGFGSREEWTELTMMLRIVMNCLLLGLKLAILI